MRLIHFLVGIVIGLGAGMTIGAVVVQAVVLP